MNNEIKQSDLEDLSYELNVCLEGMLYFAGVKRKNLKKAVEIYIDKIDEVLDDNDVSGVDEAILMIEYMKKNYKELF